MFKRIWNYFFKKKRSDIDLDEAARGFVEEVFPPKSKLEECDNLVELLDKKHFNCLDQEADPLGDVTEIPDNSVIMGTANIPSRGEPCVSLKREITEEVNRPDCIQKVKPLWDTSAKIQTINQASTPCKNPSTRGRRRT